MALLLLAVGVLVGTGAVALVAASRRWVSRLGAAGTVAGCVIGIIPALRVLAGAPLASLRVGWDVPYGAFLVEIDALSAFFLVPILTLSALAAVYGTEYLQAYREKRPLGTTWFFFNLLVASMVLVVVARNAVLFLLAWELMALASFFLVTFEDDQPSVRDAGWIYLVATHLGTACLLALFILLGRGSGTLDFDGLRATAAPAGLLFLLAVVGFGTKAGFMPFHVWLPEAHPAAPSHVSAVMSGVMIKTGIYGLVRILTFLGPPPAWWGWLLCGVGLTSGVLGVLFALAQHDLKRLLAYHSVENIGIIALGLGVGELGLSAGSAPLAVLGLAGALLHVLNHAIFKGLLFLGAGAVAHATGTLEIDHLGGLLKRMPWTGAVFLIGAVAISGLPPLNGFVSEFLVYLGAFRGAVSADATATVPLLCVIAGLALIGGLAVACFTKAFGIAFLGEPRTEPAAHAHEPGLAMRLPMLLLAACCVGIGCLGPVAVRGVRPVVEQVSGLSPETVRDVTASATGPLAFVGSTALALLILSALLAGLRQRLLASRHVKERCTWDCGYARPSARMQYTASSFAQPLTELFGLFLQSRRHLVPPQGFFPRRASLTTETPDLCTRALFGPAFTAIGRGLSVLRWLQHGQVHLYILYIALTLLVLLVWKLGLLMMLASISPLLSALLLGPLLLGVIARTKAIVAGRTGQPLLQPYYDLAKLLGKSTVYSRTTTWVFRAAPVVGLAAVLCAATLVPLGGAAAPIRFEGDLLLFAYLLGLLRFFTVVAALDTGSSFEGMGASREVTFAALAEPVLLLALAAVARKAGSLSLSTMYAGVDATAWSATSAAFALLVGALLGVFLAENGRVPVDDPTTHLELTMIHEVMVLDHGGPDLAFILYGAAVKLWLLGALLVGLVVPIRSGNVWLDGAVATAGMLAFAAVIGIVESSMARWRLVRVPQLLVGAGVMASLALVLMLR